MATITSKILNSRGKDSGFQDLYVEAWIKNSSQDYLLGSAKTNTSGTFSISYENTELKPESGRGEQQVYFKIYRNNDLLKNTEEETRTLGQRTYPNITVDTARRVSISAYIVKGIIATPKGRGLNNYTVRAFNKKTRGETFISEGKTNRKGEYKIYYGWDKSPQRGGSGLELIVRAYETINATIPTISSPLIINALPEEIINLSVGKGTYIGLDAYTAIHEALEDSLKDTTAKDLSVREVLILANAHDLDAEETSFYVQARQWAEDWEGLTAEVYFGWFKTGHSTNWTEILNTPVEALITALDTALNENYIPESAGKQKNGLQDKIKQWTTDHLIMAKGERVERGSVGELLSSSKLNKTQRRKFMQEWQSFEGSIDEFWKKQETDLGAAKYRDLELTLQLGTVTRNHLPLIESLRNKANIKQVQDLAVMESEDWLKLMNEGDIEVPEDMPGKDTKSRRQEFATQLHTLTEEMLPTAVLARSFKKDTKIESGTLDTFMERNPDFEYRNTTVRSYIKENPEALNGIQDKEAAQHELEAVQRIFHMTPTREKAKTAKVLWQNNLHSAYAIKIGGLQQLRSLFNGNEELAAKIYSKADIRHNRTKMVKMKLHSVSTNAYALFPSRLDLFKELDNAADLEALFGDQGYCKCKHCGSFFSPSAYLADLFLYLNKVKVSTKNTDPDEDTALEKLFKRRPDLGNIQLDCENSHTPLPYIDLVNEIMEMSIVPTAYTMSNINILGKTFTLPIANVPQTESETAVLKAYPQHIKQEAYNILRTGDNDQGIGFPWILPFNLWMEEVRAYLGHLGISRVNLMESILGGEIESEAIAAEYLNLLPEERSILSEGSANVTSTKKNWGTTLNQLKKVTVFLEQTGYSYEQLTKLLRIRYLQPEMSVVFNPASSCKVSDASLPKLTHTLLSRMHKFGRLILKTKEDMHDLDRSIMAFGGEISDEFLLHFSNVLRIENIIRKKVSRKEVLSWWAPLDRVDYNNDISLHTKLFKIPEIVEAFKLNETRDELATPGMTIDPNVSPVEVDHLAHILSMTRLKASDLELLVASELPDGVITLNLTQLSYVYRTASFCRAMKLKIGDYLSLKNMFGYEPLTSVVETANPRQTLDFIQTHEIIEKTGLEVETLDYLLRHQFRASAPFVITDKEIESVLRSLYEKMLPLNQEVYPAGTTQRNIVEMKLKMIFTPQQTTGSDEQASSEKAISMFTAIGQLVTKDKDETDGNQQDTLTEEQEDFIDQQLSLFLDPPDFKLKLAGSSFADLQGYYEYILKVINLYLLENTIVHHLSEAFSISPKLADLLLRQYLVHPSDHGKKAIVPFLDEFLTQAKQLTDPNEKKDWTIEEFPDQFYIVLRLHKSSVLINALGMTVDEIPFLMKGGTAAGLPDFNTLPTQEKHSVEEMDRWISLFELLLFKREEFGGSSSVFEILELAQADAGSSELLLTKLSEVSGWRLADLHYLTGPEGLNLNFPEDYITGGWLIKIQKTLNLVDRVGATARQMAGWTATEITKTHADSVRNAIQAKYGEEQWQEVTVPLRHNIREIQRDALVEFVLHYRKKHNQQKFDDLDDIYGYYLIDTQMATCTDTSRIVLASSSVQLFVQRIMMNLEPGMELTMSFMKEWKWRKYYRVWEANRKVFMWPENWIEPELRDDKTPIFKELENELLQGELTSQIVEKAYVNYLEKLHEVSHLKVCGMYQNSGVFHVIAHTSGTPVQYYYRKWENRSNWTAWEKIDLDIFNGEEIDGSEPGILLTPVVHNRRLFLFWPIFKLKKEPPTKVDEDVIEAEKVIIDDLKSDIRQDEQVISKKNREIDILKDQTVKIEELDEEIGFIDMSDYLEGLGQVVKNLEDEVVILIDGIGEKKIQIRRLEEHIKKIEQGYLRYKISMAWSQYRDGMWTPKKVSESTLRTPLFIGDFKKGSKIGNYGVLLEKLETGELRLKIIYTNSKKVYRLTSIFEFDDCKSQIEINQNWLSKHKYIELTNLMTSISYMKGYLGGKSLVVVPEDNSEILLLERTNLFGGKIIQSFQDSLYQTNHCFFYEDMQHSFFISPPSPGNIRGKTTSAAKSAMLKSGSNILRQSVFKVAAPNEVVTMPRNSQVQIADRGVRNTNFYDSNQSDQVIVRVKDENRLGKLTTSKVSMGPGPTQDMGPLNHIKNKIIFDVNEYTFYPFYHPYTCMFLKELNRYGIDGLLNPDTRLGEGNELLHQATPSGKGVSEFMEQYKPNLSEVNWKNAKEDIDFEHGGVYAIYNWELFYHTPLYIATRLSQDQRFDEAQRWFHYIFDPTEPEGTIPYRFWKIKPFHTYTITEMKRDLDAVMKGRESIKKQMQAWEKNPFNPHLLARFRRLAYMKTVVMKYLDNLIAWGDQLFRRDSIESLNEATQLYVLAGQILGKLPVETDAKPRDSKSFNTLAKSLTEMGNAWVTLENMMIEEYEEEEDKGSRRVIIRSDTLRNPNSRKISTANTRTVQRRANSGILEDILYFCMSPNEKLLTYWDTVADRLFKIRNCMNIEGLIRDVPLFQPPIDPALLVKAAAAGVDISSAINDLAAPMPYYRFHVLIQKAQELCQELKSLGGALLTALEKNDAEQLSLIRSQHEVQFLEANKDIRKLQIEEARLSEAALMESQELAKIRLNNYTNRDYISPAEGVSIGLSASAILFEIIAGFSATTAAAVSQFPDIKVSSHAQGLSSGSSVEVHPPGTGDKAEKSAMSFSSFFSLLASVSRQSSGIISTFAGYDRRQEEWDLQIVLAEQEIKQFEKQILGAGIRREIAALEKDNLDLQIENVKVVDAFMRNKYTNQQLYSWMTGQISSIFFQTYKMAFDLAKKAERAFQFELGIESSNYIQFGYWDNLKKGLLAGEKLHHDLKRLDIAFLEKNKRDYEITKHLSLSLINPTALLQLKEKGSCTFEIPELLFDLDHPGQYFRRIKSVSITIPCIMGPYASVSAKLTLMKNRIRKNGNSQTDYAYTGIEDNKFTHNLVGMQSIATSSAQGDSGMFELNFRDERYLPFEGAGAVSTWKLELPDDFRSFNYDTISDVILHLNYTAREGGDALKIKVNDHVKTTLNKWMDELAEEGTGLVRLISMKQEFSTEWHRFLRARQEDGQQAFLHKLAFELKQQHFPYFLRSKQLSLNKVSVALKPNNSDALDAAIDLPVQLFEGEGETASIVSPTSDNGLQKGTADLPMISFEPETSPLGWWRVQLDNGKVPDELKEDQNSDSTVIDQKMIEDMYLILTYTIESS